MDELNWQSWLPSFQSVTALHLNTTLPLSDRTAQLQRKQGTRPLEARLPFTRAIQENVCEQCL